MSNDKKELMIELMNLRKEKEKRQTEKLRLYNSGKKVHKKQLKFHKCKKRNRWVFGGNRSGKSECGAVEVVWMALGVHPFRPNRESTIGWVVSLSTRVQKDVAQAKILSYLEPRFIDEIVMQSGSASNPEVGVVDRIVVKNVFGKKSVIAFKSCEEGRDKFQGASLDYVWFDEEPPKEVYAECVMRVLDKKGDIFGTMTPLKGLSFVYEDIYLNKMGDPEVWCTFFEWADNPFLNKAEIKRLTAMLSPEELLARRYGKFSVGRQGLVYPEFEEGYHIVEPFEVPVEWQAGLSIDPGFNNPTSCHWYAVDGDGNIFVVAEHYEAGKPVSYHAQKIREICEDLGWRREASGEISALIDSASTQRTLASIKTVADLFREEGIRVNPKVNKNLFDGITKVKEYLKIEEGSPTIYIFSGCVNLIREIKGYMWSANDVPRKENDHALDELRYFVMSLNPKSGEEKPEISVIQKDKRRLMRQIRQSRR